MIPVNLKKQISTASHFVIILARTKQDMIFDSRVVGINKIVKDVEAAEERIKLYAAPINNKRLQLPNPCTTTGECMDCESDTRICNVTTIMEKNPKFTDVHVFVVGEELGF